MSVLKWKRRYFYVVRRLKKEFFLKGLGCWRKGWAKSIRKVVEICWWRWRKPQARPQENHILNGYQACKRIIMDQEAINWDTISPFPPPFFLGFERATRAVNRNRALLILLSSKKVGTLTSLRDLIWGADGFIRLRRIVTATLRSFIRFSFNSSHQLN